jgi:hypothetical protein
MNRDVLEKLGFKELKKLIRLLDLDIDDEYLSTCSDEGRTTLIDLMFDELEEVRKERDESNTLPIYYQERRFSNLEDIFGKQINLNQEDFDFPELYNVTRIMLLLRDPQWVFAYWDISLQDRKILETHHKNDSLCIILQERPRVDGSQLERVEIPVSLDDSQWYITLPRRDTYYSAVLGYYHNENVEVLAHSNIIQVPRGNLSSSYLSSTSVETELILMLSSIEKLGIISHDDPSEERLQLQSD